MATSMFYPPHEPRVQTKGYVAIRKYLVVTADSPCRICSVRRSTLAVASQNPAGASELEVHHAVVEWSLTNSVDLGRFNERVVRAHRAVAGHDRLYDQDFSQSLMAQWIDHHPDNLWVLCDVHHRHHAVGVHGITGPVWSAQALVKDGYLVRPELF